MTLEIIIAGGLILLGIYSYIQYYLERIDDVLRRHAHRIYDLEKRTGLK